MSDNKKDSPTKAKKNEDDDIDEEIKEEYSEDFEEDVEESSQKETAKKSPQRGSLKKGESPAKQQSPKTKLDFPEKGLQKDKDLKASLKDEEFKSSSKELGSLGGLDKEKKLFSASLDAATLERIELEECLSELRSILKKKRVLYLQFCEEKENLRYKAELQAKEVKEAIVPLSKVEIELNKQVPTPEEQFRANRKGYISLDDFIDVLKKFDYKKTNKDLIIKFLSALNCYFKPSNQVYYLKILRQLTGRTNNFNKLTNTFDYVKKPKTFTNEGTALDHIRTVMSQVAKKTKKKIEDHKKQLQKDYDLEISIDDLAKDPSKFLEWLRDKVAASKRSLTEIFKTFDNNGDGMISFEEFKKAMEQTGIKFPEKVIKQLFKRFDTNESGSVSYMEFLSAIWSDTQKGNVFDVMQKTENNLEKLRRILQAQFPSFSDMRSKMELEKVDKMTEAELKMFVNSVTDVFSRLQLSDIFIYLDTERKGYLDGTQIKRMFETDQRKLAPITEKKPSLEEELKKLEEKHKKEDKEPTEEEKLLAEKKENRKKLLKELEIEGDEDVTKLTEKKVLEVFGVQDDTDTASRKKYLTTKGRVPPSQYYRQESLKRSDLLEKFMVELSNSTLNILRSEGKNLRDMFNIFSKEVNGFLNQEEFYQACKFIMAGHIELEFANSFFNFFVVGYPRKMTFNTFSHIIFTGKKGNSIYIKLKHRFKQNLEASRKTFIDEFQRLDASRGNGELFLTDFIELFSLNDVYLEEEDFKLLEREEIIVTRKERKYVRYERFMKIIFPDSNPIETQIQLQAATKLKRFFVRVRRVREKEKKKKEEEAKKAQELKLKGSKGKKGRSVSRNAKATTTSAEPSVRIEESARAKPKEIYEFEKGQHGTPRGTAKAEPVASTDKKRSASTKRTKRAEPAKELSLEEKLKKTLGEPAKDDRTKEKISAIHNKCKAMILEIIDNVVGFGESLNLTKEIQKKYETRPVIKDVFVTLQDLEIEIMDLIPRSLSISTSTGRAGYMDKDGNLYEYDIANKQNLKSVNLSSKVPLKKSRIIDYAFDNKADRIYTLTDSWMLEVWEIHQDLTVPFSRLKILTEAHDPDAISNTYFKRYGDTFPHFMALSSSSHQMLIVNCSCVNNSIVFVDPVSVSILSQVYLNQEDYKVPTSLTKTLFYLKPKIDNMVKNTQTFEKMFEHHLVLKTHNNRFIIPRASFIELFKTVFELSSVISDHELNELYDFLDQDSDGEISLPELYYLHDLTKTIISRPAEEKITLPLALKGLEEGTLRALQKLTNFVKKSRLNLADAFKIFDENGNGNISASEFFDVIDQLVEDVSFEDKQNLIKVADQDGNGFINFEEFCSLFADVEQYNSMTEMRKGLNLRTHMFTLIEKAYYCGIDVENEFLKYDSTAEGSLQVIDFKAFIRSLPFGVLDSEIEELLENDVIYTDNGRVDYQHIIQNAEFKKIKIIAKLKDTNKDEINKLLHKIETDQHFFEPQKIIVESVLYIDDFDLMVYTTITPRTSTIFISRTKRDRASKDSGADTSNIFANKLLAKLEGHRSSTPPTIYYCTESGCLISGDKIDRKNEYVPKSATNKATEPSLKEPYINFYTNIEANKKFTTDILIWNLQKDLFNLCNTNPPWLVRPTKIIRAAHYDSILDIVYLPLNQLIVTTSADKTIKIWDPVSRPYSLKHPKDISFVRQKPGIYDIAPEQSTISNAEFSEIKRIYTGEQTCHKLAVGTFRIPIVNTQNEQNLTGRQAHLEMLMALCLSKPQLTNKTMKSAGVIKGYSVDRLEMEIPANRVDDVIPRKYYKELEDLCLERRKKALVYLQNHLPTLLETMKVKVFIQNNDLKKIVSLFKRVSLMKFSPQEKSDLVADIKELFNLFTSLPLRLSFEKFLGETGLKKQLSIPELFYYLKKFRQIHPLSVTKTEFNRVLQDVNKRLKKTIFSEKKTLNPLIESISTQIKAGKIDFKNDLYKNQKQGFVTRDELTDYVEKLGVTTNEKDVQELLNSLDPYIVNKIKLETIEDMFGNEILEYKLGLYSRPNQIMKNLTGHMDGRQKMLLIFALNECNLNKDSYLTKEEFLQAFITSGVIFNKLEVIELFELLAEKYSKTDDKKYLNLNYFSKKLFTPTENYELVKIYYILGKIKNGFIFKRINPQQIFAEYNPETRTYDKTSNISISTQDFIKRIENINIPNLHKHELTKAAYFLSIKNQLSNTPFVSLNLLLYYFRRLEVKYQFSTGSDVTRLCETISFILLKEADITALYNKMQRRKLDPPTLRHILNEIKVDIDLVDEILARFFDEEETHLEHFLTKLKAFAQSMSSLAVPKPVSTDKLISPKGIISPKTTFSPKTGASPSPEKPAEEKFELKDLLRTKTKESGKSVSFRSIGENEHIYDVVNAIRVEGKDAIQNLKKVCQSFDQKKTGKLKLPAFTNILLFNCKSITDDMAMKFQAQYERVYRENMVDYLTFVDEYLTDKEPIAATKPKLELSINPIMVKIATAIKSSKVNVNYAFRFFDEKLTNTVSIDDFKKLFAWIKADLSPEEFDFLIDFFKNSSGKIDYSGFLTQIEVSNHNLSVVFDKLTWKVASEVAKSELLEKASRNSEYVKFMVNQKLKEGNSPVQLPLLPAIILHKALGSLKYEFTIKEIDDLVHYAIIGSQISPQEAQNKLKNLDLLDIGTQILNFDQFMQSLTIMIDARKQGEISQGRSSISKAPAIDAQKILEEKHLVNKIKGILKDRDVSLWDSIISSDMTITEQSKISIHEFSVILNSLNLGLTLKEKLMLHGIADPMNTRKVDLKSLIEILEEKGLTEKVMKVILEKLGIALFFNDLSFKSAFDYFDIDKDDTISHNEFIYGFSQLDLGLSIFEISQLAKMVDLNGDGTITRSEFTKGFENLFRKYEVDPSKDLSFSLYAKIKNLLSVKGVDLLDCLKQADLHKKGYLTYDGFARALDTFGLENLKPYQLTALLKLNKVPEEPKDPKEKQASTRKLNLLLSPKNPEYKVYYESFYENLIREVDKSLKMVIEVTHDLLRKIYKMIQSKNVSLFEAFVHFDVNTNNAISKLEFKLGLQNFNIYISERDLNLVWNSFEKTRNFKVTFQSFLKSFIDAGALQIIKFDEAMDLLLKKFIGLMHKIGNFEEAFRKLDINNSGTVPFNEFRDQCSRLHLGLLPNEIETIFNVLCQNDKEKQQQKLPNEAAVKGFTYRQFVRLGLKYKNMSLLNTIFAKVHKNALERKIIWKQQFGTLKAEGKQKGAGDLALKDLKALLKHLKLGISNDEIDTIINSFDSPVVNYQTFERRVSEGAKKTEESAKEKDLLIYSLVHEINTAIFREKIPLERLFFDFDINQLGTLDISEFTNMIFFLKITANKNQIKILFETIDYDKKGYLTLPELKNFLEESKIQLETKVDEKVEIQDKEKSKINEIYLKVKEGLVNSNTNLSRVITNANHKLSEAMTLTALEKMLIAIDVILKKDELNLLFKAISDSAGNSICSFEDFQNFAIKNQIEVLPFDDKIQHIHPAVGVYIDKMNDIFKKLEINPSVGFKYLCHTTRNVIIKRNFMRGIQAFGMGLTQDDIVLLYEYFDEKGYGEIAYDTFLEKFELLITMGILKLSGPSELAVDENKETDLALHKISSRHQLIAILQKIYMYFVEKKYNKRQMVALFDRNGNGILTKDDFIEGLKALGLDIPLEKARVLANFLDAGDTGVVEVDDFVSRVQQSVPQHIRGDLKSSQALNVLRNIIDKLRDQTTNFLRDMVSFEKSLKSEDQVLYRPKTGINIFDFYKLLKDYGVNLHEDDKVIIKEVYLLPSSTTFLDIEAIYRTIENISNTLISSSFASGPTETHQEDKDLNDIFEQKVYRKIGEQLRRMNISITQAFEYIDKDKNGYISEKELRTLFKSLSMDFTEREIGFLVSKFEGSQHGIVAKTEFLEKFWHSFARFGQTMESDRIKDLKSHQRKALTHMLTFCKEKKKWTLEQAWVSLDYNKTGMITLDDLKNALVYHGLFITKEDIAMIFNFVDSQTQDGKIDFMEFCDFWNENINIFDDGIPVDNELKQLEGDILEHLAKIVDQRELSLWEFYQTIDIENKGYLTVREFSFLLRKIGLDLDDVKIERLMRLIDINSDKRLAFTELESKLRQYGLKVKRQLELERVKWIDKGLRNLLIGLNTNLKLESFEEFFKKFDTDFDGYLTPEEFFNALGSLGKVLSNEQAERAANVFQTSTKDNRISIQKVIECLERMGDTAETKSDQYEIVSIGEESFHYIVINFEGISKLFLSLNELKKTYKDVINYITKNRKKVRGYLLMAFQNSANLLAKKIALTNAHLEKGMNLLMRVSNNFIVNDKMVKLIDPVHNVPAADREIVKERDYELERVQIAQIGDNAAFNVDYDSLSYLSPCIKLFKGFYFRTNVQTQIVFYDKNTLSIVCSDGNQFYKHLDFEIKLQSMLASRGDYIFKNLSKYEKKVGLDSSEKDVYLLNEFIDDTKWISLKDLIRENGGLLRIPFLTRTKAVIYIIKFWAAQILKIIHEVHKLGCTLLLLRPENIYVSKDGQKVKFRSLRGCGKLNEFGKVQMAPDFYINLFDPDVKVNPENNTTHKIEVNEEKIFADPYLAPEMIFNKIQDLEQNVDAWAFGCLMYHILFGVTPTSFYQEIIKIYPEVKKDVKSFAIPSDYFYHDLFPDTLVNDILSSDHEVEGADSAKRRMVDCVDQKSYEAFFGGIIPQKNILNEEFNKENKEHLNRIGCYLDLIAACLDFNPAKRPTIQSLVLSPVFQLDKYEDMISRQFSEVMIFYKSPSLTIRDKVLVPLRKICAQVIESPKKIINLEHAILGIMDIVNWSLIERKPKTVEEMKKTSTVKFATTESSQFNASFTSQFGKTQALKKETAETIKSRANNQLLVKFIFQNHVLDLLVFLSLRHHTQSRQYLKKRSTKVERTYEDTVRLLKGMLEIFKSVIFDMTSYQTSCSPYVQNFLENFVKFFLGEEFKLTSDMADLLSDKHDARIVRNTFDEYKQTKLEIAESFFRDPTDKHRDEADEAWKRNFPSRPYIYSESHWTPDLYLIVGPVYKESISESGAGSVEYPVIQDYLNFETENNRSFDFDMENRLTFMNHKAGTAFRRTVDYYNDIMHIAENLQILYQSDARSKSNIRVSLQYLKALLQSNNTDKIKLLLDSKIVVSAMKFLAIDDVHIKTELLEMLYEISKGFEREPLSLITQDKSEALKSIEENLKTIGVISQLKESKIKDKNTKDKLITYSYDYYAFNKKINSKYVKQLGYIFESPVVITYVTAVIKTQAELLQNKKLVIRIFENITNGPLSVIKGLNYGTTDTISSICKIFVTSRKGIEIKQNAILAPILVGTFKKILSDCRPELIDHLNHIPGTRVFLKEQGLEVPPKLNLTLLYDKYSSLADFYGRNRDRLVQEIQGGIIASQMNTMNHNTDTLLKFNTQIYQNNTMILSWLTHYFTRKEGGLVYVDVKQYFDKAIDLYINIFDHLVEYAQLNDICSDILNQIGYLFESIGVTEFHYLFISTKDMERAQRILNWVLDKLFYFINYYAGLDLNERENELKERDDNLRATNAFGKEKTTLILTNIMNKQSLKRYGENKLMPTYKAFLRMLYFLSSINNHENHTLLKKTEFAKFFVEILKSQYHIISSIIHTGTENIHLIMNYAEESQLRLKTIEKMLTIDDNIIKEEFIKTGIIHDYCNKYLKNHDQLDVSTYKLTFKFLPFRNFLPIRNEALAVISMISVHKEKCPSIYTDLILALTRYSNIRSEYENLKKYKKGLIAVSSFYFFTIMLQMKDPQLLHILKNENVITYLKELFAKPNEMVHYYHDLIKLLENV